MTDQARFAPTILAGRWLIGIALVHALFGLWLGRDAVAAIARDGLLDAVDGRPARSLVFWFLLLSPLMAMLGQLVVADARRGQPPPRVLGWELLALVLACGVLMPASGFWLALVPAGLLIRHGTPAPSAR